MNFTIKCTLAGIISVFLFLPSLGMALTDDIQLKLLQQYPQPLRWDNVENAPQEVKEKESDYCFCNATNVYTLEPGQSTTVRVHEGEMVRIHQAGGIISPHEFVFSLSNGTGLYVQVQAIPSEDGQSLLIAPRTRSDYLLRIERGKEQKGALQFGVYTSRHDTLRKIAPYRNVLCLGGEGVDVNQRGRGGSLKYWNIEGGKPFKINFSGSRRLNFEHRLHLPSTEGSQSHTYRIFISLDGAPYETYEYNIKADTFKQVIVDSAAQPVGPLENAFIEVPAGSHEISIESTSRLLGRLLEQEVSDYLIPSLNEPEISATDARKMPPSRFAGKSPFELTKEEIRSVIQGKNQAFEDVKLATNILLKDTENEGGLAAAMAMFKVAEEHPEDRQVRREAEQLISTATFFRNLLPMEVPLSGEAEFLWFFTPTLKDTRIYNRNIADNIQKQFETDFLKAIVGSPFVTVNGQKKEIVTYRLPKLPAPTILRIAGLPASSGLNTEFYIQLDKEKPRRMNLYPNPELLDSDAPFDLLLNKSLYNKPLALMAAEGMEERAATKGLTINGMFNAEKVPGKLANAGSVELFIPRGTKEISIWSDPYSSVKVALQYRASKPLDISESEAREIISQVKDPYAELVKRLVMLRNKIKVGIFMPEEEGMNGNGKESIKQRELDRLWAPLLSILESRAGLVLGSISRSSRGGKKLKPENIKRLQVAAENAEKEGKHHVALARWSTLLHGSTGDIQENAEFHVARALINIGEVYLAKNIMTGLFVFSKNSYTRLKVEEEMRRIAEPNDLLGLYAADAVNSPTHISLRSLAIALNDTGNYKEALIVGDTLPPEMLLETELAQAAYLTGWKERSQRYQQRIEIREKRDFFRGIQFQKDGDYKSALNAFRMAGEKGRHWADALEEGLSIVNSLHSSSLAERQKAVKKWQLWQDSHPGSTVWRSEQNHVTSFPSTALIYNAKRKNYSQRIIGNEVQPIIVDVVGPAVLRFDVRPIHVKSFGNPLFGWINVKNEDDVRSYSVGNNTIMEHYSIVGAKKYVGRRELFEYQLPPGSHRLEITSEDFEFAFSLEARRPTLPLTVLPALTTETVKVANVTETDDGRSSEYHLSFFPEDQERLLLLDHMSHIVHEGELDSKYYQTALQKGEQLYLENRDDPEMRSLYTRLIRNSDLVPVKTVEMSEGIKTVTMEGWSPEGDVMTSRKALLTPTGSDEQVLSGDRVLTSSFTNNIRKKIRVTLKRDTVGYIAPEPLDISWDLNSGKKRLLTLSPTEPEKSFTVNVPNGRHNLNLAIENPTSNAFLRVKIAEKTGNGFKPIKKTFSRGYYVASKRTPVVVNVEGPKILHVNELKHGNIIKDYRVVKPGWQQLKFYPDAGERQKVLRFFTRQVAVDEKPKKPMQDMLADRKEEKVKEPITVDFDKKGKFVNFQDEYPLDGNNMTFNGQEDGTWTLGSMYQQRKFLDVVGDTGIDNINFDESFLDTYLEHHYQDDDNRIQYYTRGILRNRRWGGPLYGLEERIYHQPMWSDLKVRGKLWAYLQQPQHFLGGHSIWTTGLDATVYQLRDISAKVYHIPYVSQLGRFISFNGRNGVFTSKEIDQDIYTPYKDDHKWMTSVGDTLYYRPWLDTVLFASGEVILNENYTIDNIPFSLGVRQLLGPFEVELKGKTRFSLIDKHRKKAKQLNYFVANVRYDYWINNSNRIQFGLNFNRDASRGKTTSYFYAEWHFGNGRGNRDFLHGDGDFFNLREQRVPLNSNNSLTYEH